MIAYLFAVCIGRYLSDYTEFSFDMSWLDGGDRYSCSILAK
jgi:hypothetical protein